MSGYQPVIDWSADVNLPVAGNSPRARHTSATGAQKAAKGRPELALAYLALLKAVGPLSDHKAANALGRPLSSINSTRAGLGELVVDSGEVETSEWGTKRTKWKAA